MGVSLTILIWRSLLRFPLLLSRPDDEITRQCSCCMGCVPLTTVTDVGGACWQLLSAPVSHEHWLVRRRIKQMSKPLNWIHACIIISDIVVSGNGGRGRYQPTDWLTSPRRLAWFEAGLAVSVHSLNEPGTLAVFLLPDFNPVSKDFH